MDGTKKIGEFRPHYEEIPYYHSFGMTENYFILVENPLFMPSVLVMAFRKITKLTMGDLMREDKSKPVAISVIDRRTGQLKQRYLAQHFFVFHHCNAYEDGSDIVMDLCAFEDATIVQECYLENLKSNGFSAMNRSLAELRRYRLSCVDTPRGKDPIKLPTNINGADYDLIYSGLEFPRINYLKYNGQSYRYAYGISNLLSETLVKVNVDTKESYEWKEECTSPSEPVFLPAHDAQDEDDGVVVSIVTGAKEKKSFLLVLDGKTFKEIARAEVSETIKPSFHGDFFASTK